MSNRVKASFSLTITTPAGPPTIRFKDSIEPSEHGIESSQYDVFMKRRLYTEVFLDPRNPFLR